MVAWAQLLIGIGTMIGALFGAGLGTYSVVRIQRGSRQAAEHAADHLLRPNVENDILLAAALEILHQHHQSELPETHHAPPGEHHEHHHGGGDTP